MPSAVAIDAEQGTISHLSWPVDTLLRAPNHEAGTTRKAKGTALLALLHTVTCYIVEAHFNTSRLFCTSTHSILLQYPFDVALTVPVVGAKRGGLYLTRPVCMFQY